MKKWRRSAVWLPCLLALASGRAPAVPPVQPAEVTVGKPAEVRILAEAAGPGRQIYFRPGGPALTPGRGIPGHAVAVAANASLALVADQAGGLHILDPANSENPVIGRLESTSVYTLLALDGSTAGLVHDTRLEILSLSHPARPRIVSHYEAGTDIRDLAMGQGVAALLSGQQLLLMDLQQPAQPRRLTSLGLSFPARHLALAGNRLYLAGGDHGLLIIDISDPRRPVVQGRYQASGPVLDVDVRGGLALLADGSHGLTLVDVSDPAHPRWLGSHQQLGDVRRVQGLTGGRALAMNARHQLFLLDISSPAMPSLTAALVLDQALQDVADAPGGPLLVVGGRLASLDLDAQPPQIGNEGLDFGQGVNYGGQRRLVIRDGIAYVADWFSGIHLYDIGNPRRPRLLSSLHTPGSPKGIVVRNGLAYVADDDHGLQVVDVSDPLHPRLVANLATPGLAYTPVLDGDRLYLASHRGGFQIIDITDPTSPKLLVNVDTPGKAWSIQVQKDTAYVADDEAGLLIYDVLDASHPRLLGRFSPGTAAEDVIIYGNIAYVAFFDDGLYILDVSHPENPKAVTHLATPGNARGLERRGNLLYIADWLAGIHVVDISSPYRARIVGSYDTEGAAWGVRVDGHHAYVADWWGGLLVLDVGEPGRPRPVGRYLRDDPVTRITTRGQYAYVSKGDDGLQIFDIKNPLNPTWVTGVDLPHARALALAGRRAWVAQPGGLAMVDVENPFEARRTARLPLSHEVSQLRGSGKWLYAGGEGRLSVIDAEEGRVAQTVAVPAMADLWPQGGLLYVLDRDGLIRAYAGDDLRRPLFSHRLGTQARLLRGLGDYLYVADGKGHIRVLRHLRDGGLVPAGGIAMPAAVADLQADGRHLYVVTGGHEILVYGKREKGWRLVNEYRTLARVSALHLRNGTLYLAGDRQIVAIQDLPEIVIRADRARLPSSLPTGSYDLVVRDADGGLRAVYPNALTVRMPRLRQPAFTLEDLEEVLKRRREAAGAPPP